jgi:hypothetical protein
MHVHCFLVLISTPAPLPQEQAHCKRFATVVAVSDKNERKYRTFWRERVGGSPTAPPLPSERRKSLIVRLFLALCL